MLKNNLSLISNIIVFFLFSSVNALLISFLFIYSGNLFLEIYKWLQITAIIILCSLFIKNKTISFFAISLIYCLYLTLAAYFIFTHSKLDYSFLTRNIKNIYAILPQFLLPIIIILIAGLANSFSVHRLKGKIKKNFLYTLPMIIFAVLPFITRADKLNNEFIYFVKSIYQKDEIIDYYQNSIYNNLIQQSSADKNRLLEEAKKINKENLPKYLDNIIILQIESLNSFLVNEKNTPNFMEISRQGIFFPKFYGNSVQTIMAQENILCSLPSSFDMNLVEDGEDKNILCLPEIFKYLDYKTFFIKSYDLKFAQTGEFMKNLKFNEVRADDIMGQDNIKYLWGYREDIFYKKSFDYLEKNKKDKSNFFYIEIGPTNHWPFKTPSDMESEALYKNPENHEQRLINTTHIQDQYLKIAWEEINKMFPEKNYTLIILGDHSWPAEMHKGNIFNEEGSYEENFLTSMAMVIGDEEKYKGKIINKKYSEMDIVPSILNLFQINYANKFSQSFIKELNGQTGPENNILLIQPFSNKYINIITSDNIKYQYNSGGKKMITYDLNSDPSEKNGQIAEKEKENILNMIKNLTE